MSKVLILNEELDKKLRRVLEKDAKARDITVNERAVEILAEHYGLPYYVPDPPRYQKTSDRFRLKVPVELRNALAEDAGRGGGTMRGYTLNILADKYGLPVSDPRRRPRRATA